MGVGIAAELEARMSFRSTPATWGAGARALHWIGAALVLFLIAYGWWMTHMPERAARLGHYHLHSIVGMYFVLLLALRFAWRAMDTTPSQPAAAKPWERLSANAGHAALYALMAGVVGSGWALWSAFPRRAPIEVLGVRIPYLFAEPDRAISTVAEDVHKYLSYALLAVIVIHVAAALRHHFVKRNDVLRRMLVGV
jgi:cytochrome b561